MYSKKDIEKMTTNDDLIYIFFIQLHVLSFKIQTINKTVKTVNLDF